MKSSLAKGTAIPELCASSPTLQAQVAANAIAVASYEIGTQKLEAMLAGMRPVPIDDDTLEGLRLMRASVEALSVRAWEYSEALAKYERALTGAPS